MKDDDSLFISECNDRIDAYCKKEGIQSYVVSRLKMAIVTALENKTEPLRSLISMSLCNRLIKILTNDQYNRLRRKNRYTKETKEKAMALREEGLSLWAIGHLVGCHEVTVMDWCKKS